MENVTLKAQAVVRYKSDAKARKYAPIAAFFYPRHAMQFVEGQETPNLYVVQTPTGRRITGTNSHGQAILDTLRRKGEV